MLYSWVIVHWSSTVHIQQIINPRRKWQHKCSYSTSAWSACYRPSRGRALTLMHDCCWAVIFGSSRLSEPKKFRAEPKMLDWAAPRSKRPSWSLWSSCRHTGFSCVLSRLPVSVSVSINQSHCRIHGRLRLVSTWMKLNDLERRNSYYFALFHRIR